MEAYEKVEAENGWVRRKLGCRGHSQGSRQSQRFLFVDSVEPVYFSALCIPVGSTYWNLLLDVLTGYSTV